MQVTHPREPPPSSKAAASFKARRKSEEEEGVPIVIRRASSSSGGSSKASAAKATPDKRPRMTLEEEALESFMDGMVFYPDDHTDADDQPTLLVAE